MDIYSSIGARGCNNLSTTKVFVLFGLFVGIVTITLIIILVGFPSTLGRYTGVVENVVVDLPSAYIIAIVLDFTFRRRQEKAAETISRVGLSEVSSIINGVLGLFGSMVKASSEGFIPSTIEELFGKESAELISLHLSLDGNAPVAPAVPWHKYLAREARGAFDDLTSIQERYQAFLSTETLAAIVKLRNSPLLHLFVDLPLVIKYGAKRNIQRPVLNIPLDNLWPIMQELFTAIVTIQLKAKIIHSDILPSFPSSIFRDNVKPRIGDARFTGTPGPQISIRYSRTSVNETTFGNLTQVWYE